MRDWTQADIDNLLRRNYFLQDALSKSKLVIDHLQEKVTKLEGREPENDPEANKGPDKT